MADVGYGSDFDLVRRDDFFVKDFWGYRASVDDESIDEVWRGEVLLCGFLFEEDFCDQDLTRGLCH